MYHEGYEHPCSICKAEPMQYLNGYCKGCQKRFTKNGSYRMIPPFDDTQQETLGQGLAMTGCSLYLKYGWIIGIVILISILIDYIKH